MFLSMFLDRHYRYCETSNKMKEEKETMKIQHPRMIVTMFDKDRNIIGQYKAMSLDVGYEYIDPITNEMGEVLQEAKLNSMDCSFGECESMKSPEEKEEESMELNLSKIQMQVIGNLNKAVNALNSVIPRTQSKEDKRCGTCKYWRENDVKILDGGYIEFC